MKPRLRPYRSALEIGIASVATILFFGCTPNQSLDGDNAKVSYALGAQVGTTLARQKIEIDDSTFLLGLRDGLNGKELKLDQKAYQQAILMAQQSAMKMQMQSAEVAEKNKRDGEVFLAKNKARSEVSTTSSGLQYEIIKQGKGAQPQAGDVVDVHYTGTLVDGTKFDSSVDRGAPVKISINNVIAGWSEALKLMNVGSKWKLAVPASLAYKEMGATPSIPANAVLLFEIELVGVQKPPALPKKPKK